MGEDATNNVPEDAADWCACTKGRERDGSDAAFGRECMREDTKLETFNTGLTRTSDGFTHGSWHSGCRTEAL